MRNPDPYHWPGDGGRAR